MTIETTRVTVGHRAMESLLNHREAVAAVAQEVTSDPAAREKFLDDPISFVRQTGSPMLDDVELTDRDQDLLRIVTDPEIAAIYQTGDVNRLKEHLLSSYPSLLPDPSKAALTVTDFEVAIEAFVVAVGIAVIPVASVDRVSEVARLEATIDARLASQESRLRAVEQEIGVRRTAR